MSKLPKLLANVPDWMPGAAHALMDQADLLFEKGSTKKEWVRTALTLAAQLHDVPFVPEGIERALEAKAIDVLIDVLFRIRVGHLFDDRTVRKMRKAERKIEAGKWPDNTYWLDPARRYIFPGKPGYSIEGSHAAWDEYRANTE